MDDIIKCPQCGVQNPPGNNYCFACGALIKSSLVDQNQKCPFCETSVKTSDYFCPNCSKKLREKPLSSSLGKQISIYFVSIFLPPFGLWAGVKYLIQKDPKLKKIGIFAIALTILSILITTILLINLMNEVNRQINQQLQNISF